MPLDAVGASWLVIMRDGVSIYTPISVPMALPSIFYILMNWITNY